MARRLEVEIIGDTSSLERAFRRSSRDADSWSKSVTRAARGGVVATVGFRGLGRSVAFASGAFLGGAGFVAGARAALKAASDLSEEVNKSRVLFGQSAPEIRAWASTAATALGLSQRAALQAAGNFGAMFETLGLGDRVAANMSKRLVGLGSDLASFANEDPSEMLDRLRSGLAGEAEPLRRFGILLSEARVQQEAYRLGLAKAGQKLTEQQKVLARYSLILKDSSAAQGDFAKTSESQANQERINAALREEAARRIGSVLLPAYNQATKAVNRWLGSEQHLAKVQRLTEQALQTGTRVAKGFAEVVKSIAPTVERLNSALGGTTNAVKLLLAAFVVSKVVRFAGALTGLNATMLTSKERATALRGALLRLGAIGAITIAVDVLLNKETINRKVNEFLRGNRLGFLTPKKVDILDFDIGRLEEARQQLRAFSGDAGGLTKVVEQAIAKLRELDATRLRGAQTSVKNLRRRLDGIQSKDINIGVAETGLRNILKQLALVKDKNVRVKTLEEGLKELLRRLGQVKGKTVKVSVVEQGLADVQARLDRLDQQDHVVRVRVEFDQAAAKPEDVSRLIAQQQKLLALEAERARKRAVKAFQGGEDRRALRLDQAAVESAQAELRELAKQEAAVREQIRIQGHTVALDRQMFELEQQRKDVFARIAEARRDQAQAARERVDRARQAQRDAFEEKLAFIAVARARADARKSLADGLKVANQELAAIRAQIRVEGRTADLERQLVEARQRRAEIRRQQREQVQERRSAKQFGILGFGPTGEERTPTVTTLRKRLGSFAEAVKGTFLDTKKTRDTLAAIRKVLSAGINNVSKEVRAKIAEMLADLNQQLSDNARKGPRTKAKVVNIDALLEGLGLTPEQVRALRQRLSKFGQGGGGGSGAGGRVATAPVSAGAPGGVTISGPITVVSNNPDDMLRKLQRKARRRSTQTTGPHAGNATGTTR